MFDKPWTGVLPATLCPFNDDDSIDEAGLRAYVQYLASVYGITPGLQRPHRRGHVAAQS